MADFTEYGVPSAEWLALEPTLPAIPKLSAEQLRDLLNKDREAKAAQAMIDEGLSSRVQIHDFTVTARDGATLEARTYRPAGIPLSQPLPLFIHLHGGGYLFGTLSSEDAACSRLVAAQEDQGTPTAVFNINYRHTPEHKYPTAWNDVEDAFIWVHDHIAEIGALADQVVVGGVSAGGQLTASLVFAQLHGDNERLKTLPRIRGQVLLIPCLSSLSHEGRPTDRLLRSPEASSYVQCAEAPILPLSRIGLFSSLLGINHAEVSDRDLRLNQGGASAEDVKQLPPTTLGIAGRDPLRDEALFFGKLLSENGVPTDITIFRGVPHGFRRFGKGLQRASDKYDEVASNGISWALGNPRAGSFEIKTD